MSTATVLRLPERKDVNPEDTWDLSKLYESDDAWNASLEEFKKLYPGYEQFQGKLNESPETLAACLKFDSELERLGERIGNYAYLKTTENQTDSTYQKMVGQFQNVATRAGEAGSYIRPEILAIDDETMAKFMEHPSLELYRLSLERLTRYKQYTLGEKEEQLLAMQGEMAGSASKIFRQLHDADLKFGDVENEKGESVELSPSTFSQFLISPDRNVRKTAFHQFYEQFTAHENSLAAMLSGSIQTDVYYARARGYDSALHSALYSDNVPQTVYDSLIAAVRKEPAGVVQVLRSSQTQNGLGRHSSLRHLRADPERYRCRA